MAVVTFNDVIEFNKLLEEKEYKYKLHLRDTCGCQSFWIEDLMQDKEDSIEQENNIINQEKLRKLLEDFFAKKKLTTIYNNDSKKMDFVVK